VQTGRGRYLARLEREVVAVREPPFASVQFEGPDLGSALGGPERAGVCNCSAAPRAVTSARNSIGWPSRPQLQVALPELRWRIHHAGWGLQRADCAPIMGLDPALYGYRPDPSGSTGSPSCCRGLVGGLRQDAAGRRKGWPWVLANYPNRNSRVAMGLGPTTRQHGPDACSWASGGRATTSETGPCPRRRRLP